MKITKSILAQIIKEEIEDHYNRSAYLTRLEAAKPRYKRNFAADR